MTTTREQEITQALIALKKLTQQEWEEFSKDQLLLATSALGKLLIFYRASKRPEKDDDVD